MPKGLQQSWSSGESEGGDEHKTRHVFQYSIETMIDVSTLSHGFSRFAGGDMQALLISSPSRNWNQEIHGSEH